MNNAMCSYHSLLRVSPWTELLGVGTVSHLLPESGDDREKQVSFQPLWLEETRFEEHWDNSDKTKPGSLTKIIKRHFRTPNSAA